MLVCVLFVPLRELSAYLCARACQCMCYTNPRVQLLDSGSMHIQSRGGGGGETSHARITSEDTRRASIQSRDIRIAILVRAVARARVRAIARRETAV